ncbi:transposase [Paraburkholderia sp. JPY465]|uniref:transposase n=1 Tax=Paraburkholderia sp. JPY465 TaxID=3042285 RepID=UPI003D1FD2C6
MSENRDFPKLEPVGVSDDGQRHYYDEQAKQALIDACLQPGASLAGLALKAGVNANLLRKWVRKHQEKGNAAARPVREEGLTAFAPVVEVDSVESALSVKSEPSVAPVRREPVRASQRPPLPSRLVAQELLSNLVYSGSGGNLRRRWRSSENVACQRHNQRTREGRTRPP